MTYNEIATTDITVLPGETYKAWAWRIWRMDTDAEGNECDDAPAKAAYAYAANEPHPQLARLERVAAQLPPVPACRCCGRELTGYAALQAIQDGAGIHTRCITRHWGRHAHGGKGISRCREFSSD